MEYGGGGGGSGGENDSFSDQQKRRKRYHRHTAHQIQKLEAMFTESPHPDEKQRLQLSRELGLAPRQIKFWFQNRRTQMKAQHERADNCALRAENDKIRCENIAIREALKNVICPNCGGPPTTEDSYFDEQKLRIENSQLKLELDRVSSIAAKYIGRSMPVPSLHPVHISSLELSMANFEAPLPSLDLDLLPGISPTAQSSPFQSMGLLEINKSQMTEIAVNSMQELIRLLQSDEPLWMKSSTTNCKEILNLEHYSRVFLKPNAHLKNPRLRIEATRDSGIVAMNALTLVDMLIDPNKLMELFPSIILSARTIEVISTGMLGSHSGTLLLIHQELQVLSPLVPPRKFYCLKHCRQIEHGLWAICDVSYDFSGPENQFGSSRFGSVRLPSGCLVQEMPNGYSKVIWVEHVEMQDETPPHQLYRDLFYSGSAFGAERWVATLQRMCERYASLLVPPNPARDLEGVIASPEGKRSMMKLAQRMVNVFYASIGSSYGHRWTTHSGQNEIGVQVNVHKTNDPTHPNRVVLSAATTVWLPVSPQNVFDFFKDDRTRSQWDVLSDSNSIQEIARISTGSHSGNCLSILRALNTSQNNMLILQETCTDRSGSSIVYSPVDLPNINVAMSGEDPSYIPLLPSGLVVSPDGRAEQSETATSSSSGEPAGSLITVAFQILMSSLASGKLNLESVTTVNNLIGTTVEQIKTALNCPSS